MLGYQLISNNVPLKKNNITKSNEKPSNTIVTVNPATEEIIKEYRLISKEEITTLANKSKKAFKEWKKDYRKRSGFLYAFANEFKKEKERLARIATSEMGKTVKEARSEIDKCIWAVEYFADNGGVFLHDEVINTGCV